MGSAPDVTLYLSKSLKEEHKSWATIIFWRAGRHEAGRVGTDEGTDTARKSYWRQ